MPRSIMVDPELYLEKHDAYFNWISKTVMDIRDHIGSQTTDEEIYADVRNVINFEVGIAKVREYLS